ncbi:NAD(P)H-dependent glycerol-3-phosphate dehydrogenase [Candidatus Soleaferrea massiliensis]|uniref:NAD(P)H-dependent glycerol-3-phosphate dehydrogenase n=1 Tax=Candidatus Soleaferrea massiliensis TaxID=1470354 RepID=UPI00058EC634|nr:NAD(P)H-dependent glycerol-3-phosphate dehydrogenase [Candidatus Soleaferrea massiliensis]
MADITVLGAGGFGVALSVMLERFAHRVTLWSAFSEEIEAIKRDGEHKKLLPGVPVPDSIQLTDDISCVAGKELVIFAVPSFAVRQVAQKAVSYLDENTIAANVAKGLERGTLKRLSQVLAEELPRNKVVVLSGPSHAEEVARGIPTTIVCASDDRESAQKVQDIIMNKTLRIYVNDDLIGVELGAALKNVIALAAGINDGLGLGDNSKAALMTRGITEIARLGCALGSQRETFAGLSGIGDLIVTCTSMHSRNRRAGILIGEGNTAAQAIEKVGMTVEGYISCKCAYDLSHKAGIEMPIIDQMYEVLYNDKKARDAIRDLMERPKRHESEMVWLLSR